MSQFQELHQQQSNLALIFDRLGITQEIHSVNFSKELNSKELDDLSLIIEKFSLLLNEIPPEELASKVILDQRLLIRLGNYFTMLNDFDQALGLYELSNKVEDNEWAYYNAGKILFQQEQLESAYLKYEQAIKLKPDFLQAIRAQAEILLEQGQQKKAILKLQQSQKINPNDQVTNRLLADFYLQNGEKDEALTHLKAIHHKDEQIFEQIDELEQSKSKTARFRKYFRRN